MGLLHRVLHQDCPKENAKVAEFVGVTGYNRIKGLQRNHEEQKVAYSFVNYGYGAKVLKQKLGDSAMNISQYNNHTTNIVKNVKRVGTTLAGSSH